MKKIRSTVTTGVASLGLVLGMTGFAGATSGTIENTGRNSDNTVKNKTEWKSEVKNDNTLEVENNNDETARSGKARSHDNRGGGDAMTGSASNANTVRTSMDVDNSGSGNVSMPAATATGTIKDTGRNSDNRVENEVKNSSKVENDNELTVKNNNTQTATSGKATVHDNRGGGSATTGDVSNSNSTTTTISVKN